MGIEENKAVYRRFIDEVFNQGKLDSLDQFLAPGYVVQDAPPGTPPGPEGVKQAVTMFRQAFPDLQITLDQLVAEGDWVCSRATTRGTHRGPFMGIEPTGRKVEMRGLTMVRIVDGRLTESWVKNDVMSLMTQLGAAPRAA